ncbi:hypothetical protein V1281_004216 [Nitrobacteraceae bacterium AZCC 2161]
MPLDVPKVIRPPTPAEAQFVTDQRAAEPELIRAPAKKPETR